MADLTRHEQFLNHIAHPDEPCPKPQTRTEFLLKEIAENKDEAALPPVSAEDNGDVLAVVNGAWGKATPSGLPDYSAASDGDVLSIEDGAPAWKEPSGGGGGIFAVTTTVDMGAGTFTTASATAEEIRTAAGSGQLPVLVVAMGNTGSMMIAQLTMTSAQFAQFISEDKLFGVDEQGAVTME